MASKLFEYGNESRGLGKKLSDTIYGTGLGIGENSPYTGQFKEAKKNLGQNPEDFNHDKNWLGQEYAKSSGVPFEDIIYGGTRTLADAFIERVYEKTGKLPEESQVRDFVSGNLNAAFAEKYIKGLTNFDTIKSGMVDPYIASKIDDFSPASDNSIEQGINQRMSDLAAKLEGIYGQQREALKGNVEQSYGDQKASIAKDLAGQGMLYNQPASRASFDALEREKGKSLTQGLASLSASQAQGETDISKTIESLLQNQRTSDQQARQFGQDLAFRNRGLDSAIENSYYERGLGNRGLDLAARLGQQQADARKPGSSDYLNTAIQGAGTAALIAKLFV